MGDAEEPESLQARLAGAAAKVDALESIQVETARLRRLLEEAREAAPHRAVDLAEDLEFRLRLVEEELRESAQDSFSKMAPGGPLSADALRRDVLDETVALLKSNFSSATFREMVEAAAGAAAREATAKECVSLEERLLKLENSFAHGIEDTLREEHQQEVLNNETLERQLASLDATLITAQDRLQALESGPRPQDGSAGLAALRDRLQALEGQLVGSLAAPAPSPSVDSQAFLQQIQEQVRQAIADAFPLDELGRIIDQKVAKRSESMHAELRELEAALVKAIMQQLEAKPVGEAQVLGLIDQRINQLLLKYIQR